MMHLSVDMKIPTRIDACCNFHENVMDLNKKTVVHWLVLAEIASAKVLIFVLALAVAVALAIASATRN